MRSGLYKEAHYFFKYDFENQLNDLNRLFVGTLAGELPENIVKISVAK